MRGKLFLALLLLYSLPAMATMFDFTNAPFKTWTSCEASLNTQASEASTESNEVASDDEVQPDEEVIDLLEEINNFKREVTNMEPGKYISQETVRYIVSLHIKKVSDYFSVEPENIEHEFNDTKISIPRTAKKDVELLYTDSLELVTQSKNLLLKQSKERELRPAEEFLLLAFTEYENFLRSKQDWFYNKISLFKDARALDNDLILGALAERMFLDYLSENSEQLAEGEYLNAAKPKKKKKPFIFTAKFWQKRVANKYGGGLIFFIPMAYFIWPADAWQTTVEVFTRYFGWLAPLFGG